MVATATLALQHQLVERDIPRLVEAVGRPRASTSSYAVLKGRSNYACLHRIREGVPDDQGVLVDVPEGSMASKVLELREWAEEEAKDERQRRARRRARATPTASGGRSASATASAWARPSCPYGAECFAELAREKAHRSHLVVTNHSLLAIDAIEGVPMIPEYDVVVIDEAHELVARVTQAATDELFAADVERAARRSQRHVEGNEADDLADAGEALRDAIDEARPGPVRRHPAAARRRPGAGARRRPGLHLGVPQAGRRGRGRRRHDPGEGLGAGGVRDRRPDGRRRRSPTCCG